MAEEQKLKNWLNKIATVMAVVILYNIVLTALLGYGTYYILNRFEAVSQTTKSLTEANWALEKELQSYITEAKKTKREVISSSTWIDNSQSSSDQRAFKPDSQTSVSVDFRPMIEQLINSTIQTALFKERKAAPTFSGATYVHWGRAECPTASATIYHGMMAGPTSQSSGGGVNYQCLPSDPPQYLNESGASLPLSKMTKVRYGSGPLAYYEIPCAVCEATQRSTLLVVPTRVSCPSADWTVEYVGQLFGSPPSAVQQENGSTLPSYLTYECVNVYKGSSQARLLGNSALIEKVRMECADANKCSPYRYNQPLSCVVCSK